MSRPWRSTQPVASTQPRRKQPSGRLIAALSVLPHVIAVTSLYDIPGSISDSGTIARFEVRYDLPTFEIEEDAVHELFALREERSTDGFRIELTGPVAFVGEQEEPGESEIIGLIAAAIILLIAFGSVGAMGLLIITALGGLVPGFMIIGIASRFVDMASFTPQFASMIGIGVGIDYALLIVTRFREAKGVGMSTDDAVGGILKKCVNSEAMYPLSEQDGLEAQEGRYTADALGRLVPGFMIIGIASRFVDMASFTPQFASMIGIGVGIDYAC